MEEQNLSTPEARRLAQEQINALMQNLVAPPGGDAEISLSLHQAEQMRLRNGGYPKHMYHPVLDPLVAINKAQFNALVEKGYRETYFFKEYPRFLYRRNLDPKFEGDDYIEARIVKSAGEEQHLRKAKQPASVIGGWETDAARVPAIPEGPAEDPEVTIARLEGELSVFRNGGAKQAKAERGATA